MALYIEFKPADRGTYTISCHVQSLPKQHEVVEGGEVVMVQADGHELAYILTHFTNIPVSDATRVMQWYGDHAKFIAHNL